MSPFLEAWSRTGREEGGYVDHPDDRGGPTNHGITEVVARAHGYMGDMRDLPRERAREIAKEQYWDILRLDAISVLSKPVALEMFDTGINAGQATVAKHFQRSLNALNRQQRFYPDLNPDGIVGRITVASFRAYLDQRGQDGELVMLRALNCLQGAYYIDITESREQNESFLFGWFLNRVVI